MIAEPVSGRDRAELALVRRPAFIEACSMTDVTTPASDRVRVRRLPHRGHYDRAAIDGVLDAGLVAHVAFHHEEQPWCLPMMYARVGDEVLVHGSTGSRTLRALATGIPACLTVTITDGLVLARSAFESSANYRSAMLLGAFRRVTDPDRVLAGFEAYTERLVPGRWAEIRPPTRRELAAAMLLALPIEEASAKIRGGPPDDDDSPDAALDIWAGVVPIMAGYGEPEPSPGLRAGIPLAASVRRLATGGED
jgi:nitroimidazol reductase NimA-like FMN-containing flavoprotein (pyridoxamine 5'-phosphate oxidase superfamily)